MIRFLKQRSVGFLAGCAVVLLTFSGTSCGQNQSPPSLVQPVRISFGPADTLAVSDFTSRKVLILDRSTLAPLDFIAVGNVDKNVEGRPMAVGVIGDLIFVGNAYTSRVEVWDYSKLKKKPTYILGVNMSDAHVKKPVDLAIAETAEKVFVLDQLSKVVKVFRLDGTLESTFPNDASILKAPTAIAVDDTTQEVFITDHGTFGSFSGGPGRVYIFDFAGELQGQILGKESSSGFNFGRPMGVDVIPGRIFVVDGVLGQVLIFDRTTLQGIGTLGKLGTNPGELFAPTGVLVDDVTKDVFVTSANPARVEVFKQGGLVP